MFLRKQAEDFLISIGYKAERSGRFRSGDIIKVVMQNVNSPAHLSTCMDAKPDRELLPDASEAGMIDAEKRKQAEYFPWLFKSSCAIISPAEETAEEAGLFDAYRAAGTRHFFVHHTACPLLTFFRRYDKKQQRLGVQLRPCGFSRLRLQLRLRAFFF